jgi:hypothetical protein
VAVLVSGSTQEEQLQLPLVEQQIMVTLEEVQTAVEVITQVMLVEAVEHQQLVRLEFPIIVLKVLVVMVLLC